MTEIGKTSSRDEADIASADHGDAHESSASSDAIGERTTRRRRQRGSPAGFTPMSEICDVRQLCVESARLTRLDTSKFESVGNLEAENNNQVT